MYNKCMSEGVMIDNVFRSFEHRPFVPIVNKKDGLINKLGFKQAEHQEESLIDFRDFFYSSYARDTVQDTRMRSGFSTIDNEKRKGLPFPSTQVIEKNSEKFLQLTFDKTVLVLESNRTSIQDNNGVVEGYAVKHFLIDGQDNQVLDLMSLRTGDVAKNILSFSGGRGFWQGSDKDEVSGKEYESEVLLRFPIKDDKNGLNWDPSSLTYLFQHENSHAALADFNKVNPRRIDLAVIEREVNAVALQQSRIVNKAYPASHFIDIDQQKKWIEDQLNVGYDPKELRPWMSFKSLASNGIRRDARKVLEEIAS